MNIDERSLLFQKIYTLAKEHNLRASVQDQGEGMVICLKLDSATHESSSHPFSKLFIPSQLFLDRVKPGQRSVNVSG